MRPVQLSSNANAGFAYLSLLIFLALLGFVSAMALHLEILIRNVFT
jgi:hypothetical protein